MYKAMRENLLTVCVEVSSEEDIWNNRWIAPELPAAEVKLLFVDSDSKEIVDILYWNENSGFSRFYERMFSPEFYAKPSAFGNILNLLPL